MMMTHAPYKFEDIERRMMEAGGFKNSSAMARALKISPQAISNYKKRKYMPLNLVHKVAGMYGVSLNWLCYGTGRKERIEGVYGG